MQVKIEHVKAGDLLSHAVGHSGCVTERAPHEGIEVSLPAGRSRVYLPVPLLRALLLGELEHFNGDPWKLEEIGSPDEGQGGQ